jgi:RNA polymerase sigma-70 factor (ECF subfamily)
MNLSTFESRRARLTALARGWLGDAAEAEDAVQDAWLRLRGRADGGARDSDEAWSVAVLRNLCIDRLRRRQVELREAAREAARPPVHPPSAEELATISIEAQAGLRLWAGRLSEGDLATLLLHTVFEFEHAEIGRMSGQSAATVRQRVHRALRRVRSRGDDEGEGVVTAAQEAAFSLCWRALRLHDAAGLIARVERAPARLCAVDAMASAACVPRSGSTLLHVDGAFALAWVLDGVVLCTLPLGPIASAPADAVAA